MGVRGREFSWAMFKWDCVSVPNFSPVGLTAALIGHTHTQRHMQTVTFIIQMILSLDETKDFKGRGGGPVISSYLLPSNFLKKVAQAGARTWELLVSIYCLSHKQ